MWQSNIATVFDFDFIFKKINVPYIFQVDFECDQWISSKDQNAQLTFIGFGRRTSRMDR